MKTKSKTSAIVKVAVETAKKSSFFLDGALQILLDSFLEKLAKLPATIEEGIKTGCWKAYTQLIDGLYKTAEKLDEFIPATAIVDYVDVEIRKAVQLPKQ